MKIKAITLIASLSLTMFANAAITISGSALLNVQGSTPGTDLVGGRLGLLIVDTTGDGFLNGGGNTGITTGNPLAALSYTAAGAGLTVNSTFYGDTVLARLTTTVSFGQTFIEGNLNASVASYLNKNYAIVWFDTLTTAGSETAGTGKFGIARGADWVFPAADSGTFTYGGAGNLDQLTLNNGPGGSATVSSGGVGFATNGTSYVIVPEPSAALLAAIGALGLLRRRRN